MRMDEFDQLAHVSADQGEWTKVLRSDRKCALYSRRNDAASFLTVGCWMEEMISVTSTYHGEHHLMCEQALGVGD